MAARNDLTGEGWTAEELYEWASKHPWVIEAQKAADARKQQDTEPSSS